MTARELTPAEVGEELRMPAYKVTKLIRYGDLKARRKYPRSTQRGQWLITEQAIADYKRSCA